MVTTLSSADYFDALDRLPDPTYGETSSERLASIVAMANSLTAEDRALVIYEPRVQPRFSRMAYGYNAPPVAMAILTRYLIELSQEIKSITTYSYMMTNHQHVKSDLLQINH